MARLLITAFNGPGYRTVASLAWRKTMGDAGLLVDRIDEPDNSDPDLNGSSIWLKWPEQLKDLKYESPKSLGHILAFKRLAGTLPLPRLVRQHRELTSKWLEKLFAKPVHCWVIGGHHHRLKIDGKLCPLVWFEPDTQTWPAAGLILPPDRSALSWYGSNDETGKNVVRLTAPQSAAALKGTRLVIIFGCNGVPIGKRPKAKDWHEPMSRLWQDWLKSDTGRLPMIVGWHHAKSMPAEESKLVGTDLFARKLQTLSANLSGDKFLALFEDANRIKQVTQCWGAACFEAFHKIPKDAVRPPYENLWTDCGVLAPDCTVWHANPKFDGKQLQPPFDLDQPDKLPVMLKGTAT